MSNKTPLACDLSAIEDDRLEEHKRNGEKVFNSIKDWHELPEGYAFRLPAETSIIQKTGAFISLERLCCPFFNFELEVTPDHGPVWLKIKNDQRVKEFVEANIVTQLKSENNSDWQKANNTN
jgi:hypothetical protein